MSRIINNNVSLSPPPPQGLLSHMMLDKGKALESDGNIVRCTIVVIYMHPFRYWNSMPQNSGILITALESTKDACMYA